MGMDNYGYGHGFNRSLPNGNASCCFPPGGDGVRRTPEMAGAWMAGCSGVGRVGGRGPHGPRRGADGDVASTVWPALISSARAFGRAGTRLQATQGMGAVCSKWQFFLQWLC